MLAIFDLDAQPPQFDVIHWLIAAEAARLDAGAEAIDVHVIPPTVDRDLKTWALGRQWGSTSINAAWIWKVIDPALKLLPSIASVTYHDARPDHDGMRAALGWGRYFYGWQGVRLMHERRLAPLRALLPRVSDQYVTITLREADHWPARNSRLRTWLEVADYFEVSPDPVRVIFIRDTAKAREPIKGRETCPEASVSLLRRAALYSGAICNFGVNGGPLWIAVGMGAPVVMSNLTCERAGQCVRPDYFEKHGFKGEWWNDRQILTHESDKWPDVPISAFERLEKRRWQRQQQARQGSAIPA